MKKLLVILISLCTILTTTGCDMANLTEQNKTNVDVFENELDYFVFRNQKIYLTRNLEQYVMQFQGKGCKLNRNLDIDSIKSKEHEFYQLLEDTFDITCPSDKIADSADFGMMVGGLDYDDGWIKSVDRDIYYWRVSGGISEEINAYFTGKKVTINGENSSTKNDIIKLFGQDYEYETSLVNKKYYDLTYETNNIQYQFAFNGEDELFSIYVIAYY